MTAKGSPAWYRRHERFAAVDPEIERTLRRNDARVRGTFDEWSERPVFEAFFRDSRKSRGAEYFARAFNRLADLTYADDAVQRHWHTWQMAVGAGRLLPKYDVYKLAAQDLAASATKA